MDTTYGKLDIPFRQALSLLSTVISVSASGYAVANSGLKSLGMDHGNPEMEDGHSVWLVSDEHITFGPAEPVSVGDLVRVKPAHVDPTVAYHERMHVVRGDDVLETWAVDLRGW
jgi:D-serine deaminase-like pyridoxal phosphate-dependent protein